MQVHLSQLDLDILRQQAKESYELDDGGESFAEEALTRLSEDHVHAIEEMADVGADDFLIEVFAKWDGGAVDGIIETLGSMLEDLDIELTYDEEDEEDVDDDDWDDDDDDDAEEDGEFESY